jgi:K+-sensing histidine kinase KdpD
MAINRKHISIQFNESMLRKRNKELSVLLDMSNFLSSSMNLQELLDGAIVKVLEHFDLDASRLYLLDDSGQFLTLAAYHGIETTGLEKLHINEGFSGKGVRTRSFIAQHPSELEDRKRANFLLEKGFNIIICVPLIAMDKVIGVMNLAKKKMIELDQGKIDLLIVLGNLIAVAANNAKLYKDVERKVKEIKEKKDTIKIFAYSASHDLKGPAIGIHGLAKLLHKQYQNILDKRGGSYCDQILKAAGQIELLVEKMNMYITTREAPLNIEKVEIKEITEMIRNEFAHILDKRNIKWSEPENMPEIMVDKLSITRVFQNFVDNALKYAGQGLSEIKIEYFENNGFHTFSVSDDGIGIKEADSEKLFKLFQRHETSEGIDGTGLGLAIVKEIAEKHQGKVWVEPGSEKGTAFYISISKDLA